jgi:hypothetical protein
MDGPPLDLQQGATADPTYRHGQRLACTQQALNGLGLQTFVFKWKNPEALLRSRWSHPVSQSLQDWLNHLAARLPPKNS